MADQEMMDAVGLTKAVLALLDAEQLSRAQRLNPYFANKLGGVPWDDAPPWSELFAYRIATIQNGAGLLIDGIYGPKTYAQVMRASPLELHTIDSLLVGGERFKVPFKVVDWSEPHNGGMGFYDRPGSWAPRGKNAIDMFVLHWDVCHSSQSCYQALIDRGLSIHLMIDGDEDATVYQALDLRDAVAWHASSSDVEGPENLRSVGVEINNPVLFDAKPEFMESEHEGRPIARNQLKPNGRGGDQWDHLDFTDAQKERVVQLCDAVCDALDIPKRIPREPDVVTRAKAAGVVGHYHLKSSKVDPGMTLWPVLEAAGYEIV